MAKKTGAQLDREIAEWQAARSGVSKHHFDLLARINKPGGKLRAGYLTPSGWHGDPMVIEDRKLRLEALREQPAPKFPKDPARRSHSTKQNIVNVVKGAPFNARVKFSDNSTPFGLIKQRGQPGYVDRPRWTAFVQGVFGHDVSGEGATKEAAVRAALSELPAHVRRHFEGR